MPRICVAFKNMLVELLTNLYEWCNNALIDSSTLEKS